MRCGADLWMGAGDGIGEPSRTEQPSVYNDLEATVIPNTLNVPFRQRRAPTRVTAIAICLALTGIGFGMVKLSEHPLPSTYEAIASPVEWQRMIPETQSLFANGLPLSPRDSSCSGGSDGGSDATGNQCSDPGSAVAYTSTAAFTGVVRKVALPVGSAIAASSGLAAAPAPSAGAAVARFAIVTGARDVPDLSAKITADDATRCSGGADGGTDATGNQCNESSSVTATGFPRLANADARSRPGK